jgi:aspartate-semialdehyde dehydrogenase
MNPAPPGYRVGLAGASSLLGQEILRVLKERDFPVSGLVTFEAEQEEPDLPVVDLSDHLGFTEAGDETSPGSLELVFLASRARTQAGEPSLLGRALEAAGWAGIEPAPQPSPCIVIDAVDALSDVPGGALSIPPLEETGRSGRDSALAGFRVSPHPAAIVLSALLLRLAARFEIKSSVAQVFLPASEMGPRAIEELQKQTVCLLSFQKIPQKIFGAQLAFNVLSRLPGRHACELRDLEARIRRQLRQYLAERVPVPAIRFCQVAVFYSLAFSLFVEFGQIVTAEAVSAALGGKHVAVRRSSEAAPSQVEAAGSGEILVDAVTVDPDRPSGCWIWAAVDNIRLAAENAVAIAERCLPQHPLKP